MREQAIVLGLLGRCTISKQAVHQRLGPSATTFLREVLARTIAQAAAAGPALRSGFRRILVHDSTCWSLPPRLGRHFPGPANARKRGAGVRVQSVYELRSERFLHFQLSAFTRNDQAASADVLAVLQRGDLVLRDLGYFALHAFAQIADAGAFFLSRLRFGLTLYAPGNARPLDLLGQLRPGRALDLRVELGALRLPVRVLAFPLPPAQVNARRRKARADRDHRLRHSPQYYRLLAWNIFITNAPASVLGSARVAPLYRLRWRIEIVFKSWKTHWGLRNLSCIGRRQVEPLIYSLLILAVLLHAGSTPFRSTTKRPQREISLPRFTALFALFTQLTLFSHLGAATLRTVFHQQLHAHCRYDARARQAYCLLKGHTLG